MPELPEVETIKLGLSKLIVGKTIQKVDSDNPKSFPNSQLDIQQFIVGSKIISVSRRAKLLIINLSNGYSLITHLKMTGQLVFDSLNQHFGAGHPSDSLVGRLPDRSTRVYLTFKDNSRLYFNDQRKFGWMRLYPTTLINEIEFIKKLGPEPLAGDFTWRQLKERLLTKPNAFIKPVLMDQSVLSGIGNIYADETLWMARVNPMTKSSHLSDNKIRAIFSSLRAILELSLEKGGSTDRNYVDAEGRKGSYLDFANAYGREGQPCTRCGRAIVKTRLAGRGTHYCLYCQKISK